MPKYIGKENRIKKKGNRVKELTEKVLATTTDLLLVSIYFKFEFASSSYKSGWRDGVKNNEILSEINYKSLKRTSRYLVKEGLIKVLKGKQALPEVTEKGKRKIEQTIPMYNKRRSWDGRIYLITYDIPESKNTQRNLLRRRLRKIGCVPMQQSVWITPYNPTKSISAIVSANKLEGLVVVSSLGRDGAIGGFKVSDLLDNLYGLSQINKEYKKFIVRAGLGKEEKYKLVFNYLSILKRDPQIPFDLLPENWLGDNAYQAFRRITG